MKRALLYLRVSSAEQAADTHVSLQVQEQRCRSYVEQHGWTVAAVERDTESGLKAARPGYQRVLTLARAGEVDAVIVYQASRFGRDAIEVLSRARELRELNIELVSTAEDLSSFLMLGIQAVLNEEESRRLSARVGPAKRLKASQGYWLGHAPFGTVNVKGILQPGDHFPLLEMSYRLCAESTPLHQIVGRINAARSPASMTVSTLRKILKNPAYVGRVCWDGLDVPALWQPLIDPDLWTRANAAIKARYVMRAPLSASYPFWIVGLAFCHCGARMHPKVSVRAWGKRYAYLVCGRTDRRTGWRCCDPTHHLIENVQAFVMRELEALRFEGIEAVLDALTAHQRGADAEHETRIAALRAERDRLSARLQAAKSAHLDAPATFTIADVRQVEAAVKDNIAAIDRELSQPHDPGVDVEALRRFVAGDWLTSEPASFREILRQFMDGVDVLGRGDYRLRWRVPMSA